LFLSVFSRLGRSVSLDALRIFLTWGFWFGLTRFAFFALHLARICHAQTTPSEKMQQLSMIVCHSLCSPFYNANKEFIYVHILLRTCEQSKDSQEITSLCERSYQGQLLVPSRRFE